MSNDDWTKDVDRKTEERKAKEQEAAWAKEEKERAIKQEEYQRKLKSFQRHFRCWVCNRESSGPTPQYYRSSPQTSGIGGGFAGYDWKTPDDMGQCTVCGNWAGYQCPDGQHFHNGICQKCAAKGYLPRDKKRGFFGR